MKKYFRKFRDYDHYMDEMSNGYVLPMITKFTDSKDIKYIDDYFYAEITCSKDTTLPVWFTKEEYIPTVDGESTGTPSVILNLTEGDNIVKFPHSIHTIGICIRDYNTGKRIGGNNDITKIIMKGSCKNLSCLFDNGGYNCTNITDIDVSMLDVRNATSLKGMFQCQHNIETIDVSNWDVSKVTDMSWMFNCFYLPDNNFTSHLKEIKGLETWNTASLTNLNKMFQNCVSLESLNLSNWDLSHVSSMTGTFSYCPNLKYIDISNWDVSNFTSLNGIFSGCSSLEHLNNISTWNTKNVTSISSLFTNCKKFEGELDLSNWDMSSLQHCKYVTSGIGDSSTGVILTLPKNLPLIGCMAFEHTHVNNESIEIPSTVKFISCGTTFYDFGKVDVFKRFTVAEGNEYFTTDEYGILYNKDFTRLVSIPRSVDLGDTDTFVIPSTVKQLDVCSFSRENVFSKIVLPDDYEIKVLDTNDDKSMYYYDYYNGVSYDGDDVTKFCDIGGNSLTVAMYIYTTVDTYLVNDTNPNYISYKGCIYTKDGKTLIAVPTRYNGELEIKEGCENIVKQAFWEGCGWVSTSNYRPATREGWEYTSTDSNTYSKHITTISIPASVTYIDEYQIELLNNLTKGYNFKGTNAVIITINENNPKYEISEEGFIVEKEQSEDSESGSEPTSTPDE